MRTLAITHSQDREADAFLVGRQTFEDLRSYWPDKTDDTTGVTTRRHFAAASPSRGTRSRPDQSERLSRRSG